jgi:hypothetical protein
MRRLIVASGAAALILGMMGMALSAERTKSEPSGKSLEVARAIQSAGIHGDLGTQSNPDGGVDEIGDATYRIWGKDRFETAAEISRSFWEWDDTIVVYLATGQNFPDALAMGPSSLFLGPLLLVRQNALPEPTRSELERLEPCWIVAVGGEGVIESSVLEEADQYTDPSTCDELFD